MPLGQGYSVEAQVTGSEVCLISMCKQNCLSWRVQRVGGMQIDVYRKFPVDVAFWTQATHGSNRMDYTGFRSPRELGFKEGDVIQMCPNSE